jgi:hypothetical protein
VVPVIGPVSAVALLAGLALAPHTPAQAQPGDRVAIGVSSLSHHIETAFLTVGVSIPRARSGR